MTFKLQCKADCLLPSRHVDAQHPQQCAGLAANACLHFWQHCIDSPAAAAQTTRAPAVAANQNPEPTCRSTSHNSAGVSLVPGVAPAPRRSASTPITAL